MHPSLSCGGSEDSRGWFSLLLKEAAQTLLSSDAARGQKPQLWTRLTLVNRQTSSCAGLKLNQRNSTSALLQKSDFNLPKIQIFFLQQQKQGSRRHNGLGATRTLLGSHPAWESHPTLPEQDSPVASASPTLCTGPWAPTPQPVRNTGQLGWAALNISAQPQPVSFEVTNSFGTVLANTACAPFLPCGFICFQKFNRICSPKMTI